jgi:hypothetical protein
MSKIYRRPMFRGGGTVSSYGNGIATGLAKGGMPGKRGLVTGPGGYAGELFGGSINANVPQAQYSGGATTNTGGNILSRNVNKLKNLSLPKGKNIEARLGKGIKSLYNLLPKKGLLETGSKFAMKNFPKITKGAGITAALSGPSMVADISRPQTYAALQYMKENSKNNAGVFDETAFDDFTEYDTQFQKLNDTSKYEAMPDNRGFMNKLLNPFSGFTGLREKSDKEIGLIVDQDNKKIAEKEDAAAADTGKETTVDTSGNPMPTESRKDRLKRTAKEYQEILGDGIKKDSIFDAMVTGGTALMEGEGFASAARNINKSLDPVQNIKTASRKLALEEDIAMRKAMAVSAGKSTEMSRRIAAMREAGRTPEQIADMVAGIKPESLGEKVSKLGKVDGYAEYIKENQPDVEVVTSKVDVSKKPDGKYYIADKFTIVEVKDGAVVVGSEKIIKNS